MASGWGRWLAVAALGGLIVGPGAGPARADQTFRCESNGNRRAVCPIPAGGQVRLTRTLSSAACVQGASWNQDRHFVWVDDGCRAEFAVGSSRSGAGEALAAAAIVGLAVAAAATMDDSDEDPPRAYAQYAQGYGRGYGDPYGQPNYGPPPPNYGYGQNYPPPNYGPGPNYGYPPPPPPPQRQQRRGPPGVGVPGWMVGNFAGFNAPQRLRINLSIFPDGRAQANINGSSMPAYVQNQRLFIAGSEFIVQPTTNGIITRQVSNPANETHYARR